MRGAPASPLSWQARCCQFDPRGCSALNRSSREGSLMGVFAWILGRARRLPKRGAKANRWDRTSLAPNLRVRRLEERRVLNADAAPVQTLVIDAGTSAGDGHTDTFVV